MSRTPRPLLLQLQIVVLATSLVASAACVQSKRVDPSDDGAAAAAGTAGAGAGAAVTAAPTLAASQAAPALSVSECEQLLIAAERALADVRSKAPTACASDADCVAIPTSACLVGCEDRAIARSGLTDYQIARDGLKRGGCAKWQASGCPTTTPKPPMQCQPGRAACVKNACTIVR